MTDRIPCYLFDIDGTVADNAARIPHLFKTPKDWKSYKAELPHDLPINPIIDILRVLRTRSRIIYLTGRSEESRFSTCDWLSQYAGLHTADEMFMRKKDDFRSDVIVKKEIFLTEIDPYYYVEAVFEDRSRCVEMWRSMGLTCLQVKDGDY